MLRNHPSFMSARNYGSFVMRFVCAQYEFNTRSLCRARRTCTLLEIQITRSLRIPRVLSNIRHRSFRHRRIFKREGDPRNKIIMIKIMMIVGCEIHPICLIPSSIPPLIISPAVIIRLFKRDLHKKERNTIMVVAHVIAILRDRGSINIFRF